MKIIEKTRKFFSNKNGAVFGLSGGLDSTTLAYLLRKAIPKKQIVAAILPWRFTPKQDIKDAKEIAEKLDLEIVEQDIDPLVEKLDTGLDKISLGNLAARLRMVVLYREANSCGLLVSGSSNKSELELGYYTKYGDGAADVLPLGSLYKTQVKELAKKIGVPRKIINKKPSAGFWPAQTDEKELGYNYEQIDKMLKNGNMPKNLQTRIKSGKHKTKPRIL